MPFGRFEAACTANENTQCCLATLGVSFCPSKLGGIIAPLSNVGWGTQCCLQRWSIVAIVGLQHWVFTQRCLQRWVANFTDTQCCSNQHWVMCNVGFLQDLAKPNVVYFTMLGVPNMSLFTMLGVIQCPFLQHWVQKFMLTTLGVTQCCFLQHWV